MFKVKLIFKVLIPQTFNSKCKIMFEVNERVDFYVYFGSNNPRIITAVFGCGGILWQNKFKITTLNYLMGC